MIKSFNYVIRRSKLIKKKSIITHIENRIIKVSDTLKSQKDFHKNKTDMGRLWELEEIKYIFKKL